jgi:Leucine-rich repeat (LRR) protein
LVIEPAMMAILCPEGCDCYAVKNYVKCSGTSHTAVPVFRLTGIRILSLPYTNITLLKKDTFVSLTELEELSIYKCRLRTVELGAFNGLTNLKKLYMWGVELSEIIPGTFGNLNSLDYLRLYNDRLEHLDSDTFSGLVNLQYIDLSHNKLQFVHPDTFLRLPKLEKLDLTANPALQIPTDSNFINSHSLSHLRIPECNISSLSVETFANVSALELLDLRNNKLLTVDVNILRALPKLSTIYLNYNPLKCDCQLQEVWRWCKDRNIRSVCCNGAEM